MKMKKLLAILLIACMTVSLLSISAFAEPEDEVEETDATETADAVDSSATDDSTDDSSVAGNVGTVDITAANTDEDNPADIVIDDAHMTGDGTVGNVADLASFALASENANLAFYINDITGFFALYNKKTGAIWYSNPLDWEKDEIAQAGNKLQLQSQLIVTYLNASYDTLTIPSTEAHIVSEHNGNTQILTYVFSGATRNFSIPIMYELKEDYLDVRLKIEDIEENSDARITQITLLPFVGAGGLRDNGYALIPDGCGSLMTFNKTCKNLSQYIGYIYNRDLTASSDNASYVDLNETISLPVYGVQKNGAAYLAVITEGAGTAAVKCNVSRLFNSYNSVCSHIIVRDTQTRKNATGTTGAGMYYSNETSGDMVLRVYPLEAADASYIGMAKRYRKYLIDEQGLSPIEENSKYANALNLNVFGAVKSPMHFAGIPYTGVKKLSSFDDVHNMIDVLKEGGVSNLTVTLEGWASGGLESGIDTKFNPESKLGGKKAAKSLISYAEDQNVTLVFDNDVQTFYSASSQAKLFKHTAYSLAGTPVTVYPFSKSLNRSLISGKFSHLIHPNYMVKFASDFVTNASKTGVKNYSFMTAGADPYAAYNSKSMLTRDKSVYLMNQLFKDVSEKAEGIISTKIGNSFVLGSVDNIVEAPVYSSDLIMSQTSVPFYQIVLRGYVNMTGEAMNLSSEVSELELKCAETGLSLYYMVIAEESTAFQNTSFTDYYACSFDDYSGLMKDTYSRMKKVYDAVGVSYITNHEISGDVRITTFSNGAKVYVNYGEADATVAGVKIAARSYTVVGGAA